MKAVWSYGNVFLMGVATTLLWVKWSGRWSLPKQEVNYSASASSNTVSVEDMVQVLKTPEAIEKLKLGHHPKFHNGKLTGWEKTQPATLLEGSIGN